MTYMGVHRVPQGMDNFQPKINPGYTLSLNMYRTDNVLDKRHVWSVLPSK